VVWQNRMREKKNDLISKATPYFFLRTFFFYSIYNSSLVKSTLVNPLKNSPLPLIPVSPYLYLSVIL
jgi:hypothetical protein